MGAAALRRPEKKGQKSGAGDTRGWGYQGLQSQGGTGSAEPNLEQDRLPRTQPWRTGIRARVGEPATHPENRVRVPTASLHNLLEGAPLWMPPQCELQESRETEIITARYFQGTVPSN